MRAAYNDAPKGQNEIAEGDALGLIDKFCLLALKVRDNFDSSLSGQEIVFWFSYPGRCPGLFYFALSAQ